MSTMSVLYEIRDYLFHMHETIEHNVIKAVIKQFLDDITRTLSSFDAKDSLGEFAQPTALLAASIYSKRFCSLCAKIVEYGKLSEEMRDVIAGYNNNISGQGYIRAEFVPDHILFSQQLHNIKFSRQSHFFTIHEEPVADVVEKLRSKDYDRRDFPLCIYCADFRGRERWFAVNNRTWAALSGAEILPSRVVPVLPTVELMKRLEVLEGNPNMIQAEAEDDDEQVMTASFKSCDSPRLKK